MGYNQASLSLYFEHSVGLKKKDAELVPQGSVPKRPGRAWRLFLAAWRLFLAD